MRPWHQHPHRSAAIRRDGLPVQSVSEKHRQLAGWCLHGLRVAHRRLENLRRIVVVKSAIVDPPHVLHSSAKAEDIGQRDAFPQALAQRLGDVQTLHRFDELHALRLPQFHQRRKIQRGPIRQRQWLLDLRCFLDVRRIGRRIRSDFQPPGLGRHPRLDESLSRQRVRFRLSARHIVEILRRREERVRAGLTLRRGRSTRRSAPPCHRNRRRLLHQPAAGHGRGWVGVHGSRFCPQSLIFAIRQTPPTASASAVSPAASDR